MQYHKIKTVFKRDPDNNFRTLSEGDWSIPEFGYLQHNKWVFTEKVDGTNIRIMVGPLGDGAIKFGGKTDDAQIPNFLAVALEDTFLSKTGLLSEMFDEGATLYGEGYGAKIQKGGGNYRQDHGFVLFDVRVGDWWLQRKDVEDVADRLGIDAVPVIGEGTLLDMVELGRTGFKSLWGDFYAEGVVARPEVELLTRGGRRLITKIKHKDFTAT